MAASSPAPEKGRPIGSCKGLMFFIEKECFHREPCIKGGPKFATYAKLSDCGRSRPRILHSPGQKPPSRGCPAARGCSLNPVEDMPSTAKSTRLAGPSVFPGEGRLGEQGKAWPVARKTASGPVKERCKGVKRPWEALNSCIASELPTRVQPPAIPSTGKRLLSVTAVPAFRHPVNQEHGQPVRLCHIRLFMAPRASCGSLPGIFGAVVDAGMRRLAKAPQFRAARPGVVILFPIQGGCSAAGGP